jgi:beta-xylosidase
MNSAGTAVIDQGKHIFDGHDNDHTIEGPKLHKKEGYYYVFAPAGGVATGWQLVLRSKNIYGPYEKKIVLEQGSTSINGPHQGAWITLQNGDSWFMHFQDKGVYGRVLHLQEMKWINGWPIIGKDLDGNGIGEPVIHYKKPAVGKEYPIETPQETDEFNNGKPGIQWQWYGNPSITWSAQIPETDYLRLFCIGKKELPNLWDAPNLLLQKLPAENFTVVTKVKLNIEWETAGKTAGLLMMGQSYAYAGISFEDGNFWVNQVLCNDAMGGAAEKVIEKNKLKKNEVYLKMEVKSPDALCQFSYSEDGEKFLLIGEGFKAQKDLWISAKIGIFSVSESNVRMGSYADFDWFKVSK